MLNGVNPKAAAKFAGHAKEIVIVDYYTDNRKLSVIKLTRLDDFIDSVLPSQTNENTRDLSSYRISIEEYLPV